MTQRSRKSRQPNPRPDAAPNRLPDDLRREDAPKVPSEEIPGPDSDGGLVPAGGGLTPEEDGGDPDHPMHDAGPDDDATPSDYEREIDRLDAGLGYRIG